MYPTASAPQYAFGPGLAPVPMPGMAGGGLAALARQYRKGGRIKYFEEGGEGATGGADSSTEGGAGAAFGGGSDPGPGPGSSDPGVGGGGGTDPGVAAQAAAQAVDNAVAAAQDADAVAAAEATIAGQIAAEADEAEAENAANTAAALGAQANAIAAEAIANAEEDAKNAEMAAVMSGQVEGFPGPSQATQGFGLGFQNPLTTDISKGFGLFSPFATVTTPFGKADFSVMDFAAPAMGKGASAVNSAVNAGKAMGFAEGGLAAAHKAQNAGRGQDTMLVHMTPGEVKGLQALAMAHGGSLTINPETGLPEAGFLQRILPTLLGAGLSFIPGVGPLMAAGIVGGGYGIAKGSLAEGLKAGLGAYGGAGLASGLTAAGQAASSATQTAAIPADAAAAGVTGPMAPTVSGLEAAKLGVENVLEPGGFKAITSAMPIGSGTAATTTALKALTPEPEPLKPSISNIRPYSLNISNPSGTPQYTPQDTREREQVRYTFSPQPIYQAAQGGTVDPDYNMEVDRNGGFSDAYKAGGLSALDKRRKSLSGDKYYKFADSRRDQSMEAAIEQNFAKGGLPPRFLEGAGDGMSDSIKARIGGVQEARLADGEFVVPADVVSHLGNGSSKAGAKKLYAMMDKIRKARTGRERQAPEVNAQKYMPA